LQKKEIQERQMYLGLIAIILIIYYISATQYKKTEYYAQTKNAYLGVIFNKGKNGEYRTYKYLNGLEGHKKYLFNLYLPKDNGETTELDVVLLHDSGMYVFESKNYSGWIFGTETQKNWTQTLPMGRGKSQKNHFFNPIMQNKGHIKWLKSYLQNECLPVFSCIVFSDRCTLKNINLTSGEHAVINRYNILSTVKRNATMQGTRLSVTQIDEIFNKLYPLTQVGYNVKQEHIHTIQNKKTPTKQSYMTSEKEKNTKESQICPRCGGYLKVRTASKGQNQGNKFYGCSNYPKCRYIKNITE
jgi:hypothetical protein